MIDTKSYMVAAYIVATVIYVAYVGSLWSRARKARAVILASGVILGEAKNRSASERDPSLRSG